MTTCPSWSDDSRGTAEQTALLEDQLETLVLRLAANPSVVTIPDRETLNDWHLSIFKNLVPLDYYAGNMRGDYEDMPCLAKDVYVGKVNGTPYAQVDHEISQYERTTITLLEEADKRFSSEPKLEDYDFLFEAIAWIVSYFIRIHPYLNGNGRVFRVTTNVLLFRFGFKFGLFRLNPRPDQPYGTVAAHAMQGNHLPLKYYLMQRAAYE